MACFILSQTVHSHTSAHTNFAAQYHNSPSQAHIFQPSHSIQAQRVFCIILAAHCATPQAQALILSVALTHRVSAFQANHNLAASHLLS